MFLSYLTYFSKLVTAQVCVCVCVCVCLSPFTECLFPFTVLLTEQNNKLNARVQVSDGMLQKDIYIKYLCLCVKDIHKKNLQADTYAKECQLNRAEPQEVKGNSYKFSKKTKDKSAMHRYLPLH